MKKEKIISLPASGRVNWQKAVFKTSCPLCKHKRLVQIGRAKTSGTRSTVEVLCGACGSHMNVYYERR